MRVHDKYLKQCSSLTYIANTALALLLLASCHSPTSFEGPTICACDPPPRSWIRDVVTKSNALKHDTLLMHEFDHVLVSPDQKSLLLKKKDAFSFASNELKDFQISQRIWTSGLYDISSQTFRSLNIESILNPNVSVADYYWLDENSFLAIVKEYGSDKFEIRKYKVQDLTYTALVPNTSQNTVLKFHYPWLIFNSQNTLQRLDLRDLQIKQIQNFNQLRLEPYGTSLVHLFEVSDDGQYTSLGLSQAYFDNEKTIYHSVYSELFHYLYSANFDNQHVEPVNAKTQFGEGYKQKVLLSFSPQRTYYVTYMYEDLNEYNDYHPTIRINLHQNTNDFPIRATQENRKLESEGPEFFPTNIVWQSEDSFWAWNVLDVGSQLTFNQFKQNQLKSETLATNAMAIMGYAHERIYWFEESNQKITLYTHHANQKQSIQVWENAKLIQKSIKPNHLSGYVEIQQDTVLKPYIIDFKSAQVKPLNSRKPQKQQIDLQQFKEYEWNSN